MKGPRSLAGLLLSLWTTVAFPPPSRLLAIAFFDVFLLGLVEEHFVLIQEHEVDGRDRERVRFARDSYPHANEPKAPFDDRDAELLEEAADHGLQMGFWLETHRANKREQNHLLAYARAF